MKTMPIYNMQGETVGNFELNPKVFEATINPELIYQAVSAQSSNKRIVSAHTKTRGEVRGGGRKPWKQKHTGRARQGSVRSPLWIGGGIVFGPRNERNYSKNLNKKMKRSALFMGLSDKVASKGLVLLDKLELEAAKTKGAFQILKNLDLQQKKVLVVLPLSSDIEKKVKLSFRNLGRVRLIRADSLNIVDILNHEKMIIPVETLAVMEKTYLKK